MEKPNNSSYMGWDTTMEEIQTQPGAHQSEAMARGASQGAAAPWVRPHRQHRLSGPPRSGGCMAVCGGGSRWLPKISVPNRHTFNI
jgi:hypothetical protein